MKKDLWLAYLLALAAFLGPAGLHRFYLGRPVSGVLYLLTWGLLGIGTLVDLFTLPDMVAGENAKRLEPANVHLHLDSGKEVDRALAALKSGDQATTPEVPRALPPSAERQILQLASKHDGKVTVPMVSLETSLSLKEAKKELERLRREGHCELDVTEEGAELYTFAGLGTTRPLDLS